MNLGEDNMLPKMRSQHHDFSKPGRGRAIGLAILSGFSPNHRRYWSYLDLLAGKGGVLSLQGGIFLRRLATGHASLRIAWVLRGKEKTDCVINPGQRWHIPTWST